MKRLVSLALVLVLAGGVLAQDNFGMYRMVDGEYSNFVMVDELTPGATLDLYITLHDPSVFVVGGFEVGIDMPEFTVVTDAEFDGINFGGSFTNLLVGYYTPIPAQETPVVLATLFVTVTAPDAGVCTMHGAVPPSIPGHDGPVIANGANPDELIACGYVDGTPDVFLFSEVVAVETQTFSGVKALFE